MLYGVPPYRVRIRRTEEQMCEAGLDDPEHMQCFSCRLGKQVSVQPDRVIAHGESIEDKQQWQKATSPRMVPLRRFGRYATSGRWSLLNSVLVRWLVCGAPSGIGAGMKEIAPGRRSSGSRCGYLHKRRHEKERSACLSSLSVLIIQSCLETHWPMRQGRP